MNFSNLLTAKEQKLLAVSVWCAKREGLSYYAASLTVFNSKLIFFAAFEKIEFFKVDIYRLKYQF